MRAWNSTLVDELASAEITRCFLAELENRTGQTVRLTSHDVDRTVGGDTFLKTPGFTLSRVTFKNGGEAATLDFTLPFSDEGEIFAEDVRRGAWRGATIVVWLAHTATPVAREILIQGFVGQVSFTDRLSGRMEIATLADALKDVVLLSVQPKCSFRFCGQKCGVTEATYTRAGTVTSVTSRRKFTATITSPGALNFSLGKVTFTSGDNAGTSEWVRQWTSGTGLTELVTDLPFDISVGDGFDILSGCRQNREDCIFYDNIDRFPGFDFVAN
jgi:uncharacterized phage protein (TIGR02218 family)